MIRNARQSTVAWRQVCLTLALLAVAFRIMVPPGFMVAPPSNELPFAVVLCTGDGMVVVDPGGALPHSGDGQDAPDQDPHDAPCAFAGHAGAAPLPPVADAGPPIYTAYTPVLRGVHVGVVPGRGLTGPPLPARGPPQLLI